jgi:hypothetical protein
MLHLSLDCINLTRQVEVEYIRIPAPAIWPGHGPAARRLQNTSRGVLRPAVKDQLHGTSLENPSVRMQH